MRAVRAVLAVAVLLAAAGAQAVPYVAADGREIDVEYWAGTGANQSVLIVDFRQGADDYFAFGYEWDTADAPTAADMVIALDAAGALDVDMTDYGPGLGFSVDRIRYDDGSGLMQTGDYPAYMIDGEAGDPSEEGLDWLLPIFGVSSRELVNASFDGFVHAVFPDDYEGWDYAGPEPRIPLVESGDGPDVIPEPATIALVGLGALGLLRKRKR